MIRQHEGSIGRSVIKGACRKRRDDCHGHGLRAGGARSQDASKLGYVSPQTGPLAAFAEADNFVISNFLEHGERRPQDRRRDLSDRGRGQGQPVQSQPRRRGRASELIVDDKIDLMLVASTPETTNPVSTQCEIEEVPCISTGRAVAALVHRPPGAIRATRRPGSRSTTPTTSSGASRT